MADRRHGTRQSERQASVSGGGTAGSRQSNLQEGSNRAFFVLSLFVFIALLFIIRLVFLQVIVADDYSTKAQEARTSNIETSPRRGTIYDRNGVVLAKSVDATTVYVNPHEVTDAKAEAAQIAEVLGGEATDYEEMLSKKEISFVYIKRKADVEQANALKELGLDGVYFIADTKRVYPNAQVGGQVIGACDVDGFGTCGLELYYDDILGGSSGSLEVERGAYGIPIPGGVHEETKAVDGQDIIISLDIGMQQHLEECLAEGVKDLKGKSGNAILMDASTGEIFAAASLPYFNPADRSVVEEGATQLKGITDAFEPGSIFKSVTVEAILEEGVLTPEDEIFCPAVLAVDEYKISDSHPRADMTMTFRQILANSSNVGVSLATEKLGFNQLYSKILDYNFTEATGVDYPGESSGYLLERDQWSHVQGCNISFGQGISVTPLQVLRFYGAIANDGVECTPHFLIKKLSTDEELTYPSEQVIQNKESIATLTDMLKSVVTEGTATDIVIDGYAVAGKTGTAEIANPQGGYLGDVFNVSFVGFLPDSSSQLVCFVGATEVPPERKATQVFKDIMSYAADRYKIVPSEG